MKRHNILLFALAGLAACSDKGVSPQSPPGPHLTIPYAIQDSMFGTRAQHIPAIKLYQVSGYFMSGIRTGDMTDTAGHAVTYNLPMQMAQFIDPSGAIVAPDSVALNNRGLWPLTNAVAPTIWIFSSNFANLWNNSGTNQWQVTGNSSVPSSNTPITLPYPQFNTQLPDSFDIHQPFSFTFDHSNLQHADSAFLLVYSYDGTIWTSPIVRADGGIATVDCSVSVANGGGPVNSFFNTRGYTFYGGILALVAYRTEIHQTAGKNFAYVVQTQQIRNVLFH